MFSIDHIIFLTQLLPPKLRTLRNRSFIQASIKPLIDVYNWFITHRTQIDYDLKFNGQVIYLEHVLNDQFDPVNRDIYIEDAADVDYDYIFTNSESIPLYVYENAETPATPQVYLQTNNELISQNHFIVNIPNTSIDQFALKALIDKYRLASKTYTINILP